MPPHCDTLDGPVADAARRALDAGKVNLVLPYVPEDAEEELREDFRKALSVREAGGDARALAELWFIENTVRLHRRGEGAPYTGMKPAGLDWGPVVPRAEKAVEEGDPGEVVAFLQETVADAVRGKFAKLLAARGFNEDDVPAARHYVHAMLDFVLFSAHLYQYILGEETHGG